MSVRKSGSNIHTLNNSKKEYYDVKKMNTGNTFTILEDNKGPVYDDNGNTETDGEWCKMSQVTHLLNNANIKLETMEEQLVDERGEKMAYEEYIKELREEYNKMKNRADIAEKQNEKYAKSLLSDDQLKNHKLTKLYQARDEDIYERSKELSKKKLEQLRKNFNY